MAYPEITMATTTIHNPKNPRHFMRAKPVTRTVRVMMGGQVIAETNRATRVTELGKDMLDPIFYIPRDDVTAPLTPVEGKTTHCPLKGDASYFTVEGQEIAWSYDAPLDFCDVLKGLIAFYPDRVTTIEVGENDQG
ncbi:MAG: DUF427 domain-containing protein [Devosiaceae bacterium]|nr:DUF427 domain-containing protein [Devosiaceae bacterium MH13]